MHYSLYMSALIETGVGRIFQSCSQRMPSLDVENTGGKSTDLGSECRYRIIQVIDTIDKGNIWCLETNGQFRDATLAPSSTNPAVFTSSIGNRTSSRQNKSLQRPWSRKVRSRSDLDISPSIELVVLAIRGTLYDGWIMRPACSTTRTRI